MSCVSCHLPDATIPAWIGAVGVVSSAVRGVFKWRRARTETAKERRQAANDLCDAFTSAAAAIRLAATKGQGSLDGWPPDRTDLFHAERTIRAALDGGERQRLKDAMDKLVLFRETKAAREDVRSLPWEDAASYFDGAAKDLGDAVETTRRRR